MNAGVKTYDPSSCFNTTGPWNVMAQAGDSLAIAGASVTVLSRQVIWPKHSAHSILINCCTIAPSGMPSLRQAFENLRALAEMVGAELTDCVALVVYTTDMYRYRPVCNEVQIEL